MSTTDAIAHITVKSSDQMQELGRRLAPLLRPGDLVLLTGELGAGKTTLTRGLGEGLGVRGAVTSPTFVIARVHPSLVGGPALVHVDAYRLGGGLDEMEDLDLDVSLPESVVVVEWGEGKVEELSEDRLHVVIGRAVGGGGAMGVPPDGVRGSLVQGWRSGDGRADAPGGPDGHPEDDVDDVREVTVTGHGARWADAGLPELENC
ncbi:tRNA (adenosine(37)-N6)-threonylcarbamoyltransferase complex ATPase subunit type 1 TsaE [Streptomyces inhibens]|uniref:tRNA (adenosine(37)-N6)-threonylcarbamoyltransferase complex ATPase subunit type 1 TsaE n=1 Tax=Streptomyces inhibens TaxID=2293571 RepID=UPI001EE74BF0|nr:tRNA (adenosine(37)-N6)-threonylcarbamoyltransferase complex ATPase subunit type 1 TsaE [Streptomyces inhibens]UKY50920.1 tRNA (adenosine(37)-N6)-threonylcarbamoyltransferase complex ATPase subunit type 1 TsaE [Streptomyces inhibens]